MLIFCCSMPRSGGTLLYQLTKEIAEYSGLATGKGFPKERYRDGVVKTEFCEPWMIERVKNDNAIAFGTYRDFRDVILSLRNFYNRREKIKGVKKVWTIEDVLRHRDVILDSYYGWKDYCSIWFQYEQDNLDEEIVDNISASLNIQLPDLRKALIINKYSKENNLKRIQTQKVSMEAGNGSMLTKWHIGQPTNWREELTQKEIEMIESVGGDWLREHGY